MREPEVAPQRGNQRPGHHHLRAQGQRRHEEASKEEAAAARHAPGGVAARFTAGTLPGPDAEATR